MVVRSQSAFSARYNTAGMRIAIGEYDGSGTKLSDDGEKIALSDALGSEIRRFTYSDEAPWPFAPDGRGPSLVLIAPETNPNHTLPGSWRPSTADGGNPGRSDATTFPGTAGSDVDGNGLDDLLDYALGHAPGAIAGLPAISFEDHEVLVRFHRNLAADDVVITLESSNDLETWAHTSAERISSTAHGNGVVSETWQLSIGPEEIRRYVRIAVSMR